MEFTPIFLFFRLFQALTIFCLHLNNRSIYSALKSRFREKFRLVLSKKARNIRAVFLPMTFPLQFLAATAVKGLLSNAPELTAYLILLFCYVTQWCLPATTLCKSYSSDCCICKAGFTWLAHMKTKSTRRCLLR